MAISSDFRDIFDTKLWVTKLWSAEFLENIRYMHTYACTHVCIFVLWKLRIANLRGH